MDISAGECTVRYDYYQNEEIQRLDKLLSLSDARTPPQCAHVSYVSRNIVVLLSVTRHNWKKKKNLFLHRNRHRLLRDDLNDLCEFYEKLNYFKSN